MRSQDSITSIEKLDDFLGGVSSTDYIKLWGQQPHELGRWTYANLKNDVVLFAGVMSPQVTAQNADPPEAAIIKAICHVYVQNMPTEALTELYESLKSMYEFHRVPHHALQPMPPPRSFPAKVVGRQERPPLSFNE